MPLLKWISVWDQMEISSLDSSLMMGLKTKNWDQSFSKLNTLDSSLVVFRIIQMITKFYFTLIPIKDLPLFLNPYWNEILKFGIVWKVWWLFTWVRIPAAGNNCTHLILPLRSRTQETSHTSHTSYTSHSSHTGNT